MTNQSHLNKQNGKPLKKGLKVLSASLIPLITLLVLSESLSPTSEFSPVSDQKFEMRSYTTVWDSGSFDQELWYTLEWIAKEEGFLPLEVKRFQVDILSYSDTNRTVSLDFDRSDLIRLKAGEVRPEIFIREFVKFN